MDNPTVNIYIETTAHGPSQRGGRYMYIMEFFLKSGKPETRESISGWMDEKETALVLQAAAEALERMKQPAVITIHTSCRMLWAAIENDWMEQWRQQGWTRAGGKTLQHRELWERIGAASKQHLIFVEQGEHPYRNLMQWKLKRQKDSFQK